MHFEQIAPTLQGALDQEKQVSSGPWPPPSLLYANFGNVGFYLDRDENFSFAPLHSSWWFSTDLQLNFECDSCTKWILWAQKKLPQCPAIVSGNGQSRSFSPPRALRWPIKSAPTKLVVPIDVPKSSKITYVFFATENIFWFRNSRCGERVGGESVSVLPHCSVH